MHINSNNSTTPIQRLLARYSHINWALADQALVSGVNFLTGIILARFLGIAEFGIFSFAWMAVLFINNQQASIIISPMMSIGPKQTPSEAPAYFGAVIVQQLIFSFLAALMVFLSVKLGGIYFTDWKLDKLAVPLASALFFFLLQDFLRRYFFTRGKAATAFINDIVSYLGQLLLLGGLTKIYQLDGAIALWIIALTSAVAVIVGILTLGTVTFDRTLYWPVTVRHWQSSSWITVSGLLQWVGSQGVIAITGAMLGAASLGGIRAVLNLVAPVNIIMQAMQNTLPVGASKALHNQGHEGLVRYLKRQTINIVIVVSAISLLATVFSGMLIELIYGQSFVAFSYLVKWQSLYVILGALIAPLLIYFRAIERTRSFFSCAAVATIFSLTAMMLFIKRFQEGAVYAGLLCNQVVMLLLLAHAIRGLLTEKGAIRNG